MKKSMLVALLMAAGCTSIDSGEHETHLLVDAGELGCSGVTTATTDAIACTANGVAGVCVEGIFDTTVCAERCRPSGSCVDTRLHAFAVRTKTGFACVCR